MPEESVNQAAQEYYCRLTDAGAALEAAAHAEAKPVVLTHVAVGDGGGEAPAPAASATALVNEVYRRQIDGRERDKEDPNLAWLHIIIPADVGGFWIREFGIYAQPLEEGADPVLYAYGNHAPYYKQQASQGQATTHELSIPIVLSGTAEVEISVRDAGYATALAFEDLRDTVQTDRQRLWENDGEGPGILTDVLPGGVLTEAGVGPGLHMEASPGDGRSLLAADIATLLQAGLMRPDGMTVTVDEDGLLSALGGNLLLNEEVLITESGTWVAKQTGWHIVLLISGGNGAWVAKTSGNTQLEVRAGHSGKYVLKFVYLTKGEEVPVIIGAGGPPYKYIGTNFDYNANVFGGATSFGDIDTAVPFHSFTGESQATQTDDSVICMGGGFGASTGWAANSTTDSPFYGSGGGGSVTKSQTTLAQIVANPGTQGAVFVFYNDPGKAATPVAEPATFSLRRRAVAEESQATAVTLYNPETGEGSVWKAEDAPAMRKAGLISREEWEEIRAEKAAAAHAEWLASPETEAERFALLRRARDARLKDYDVADAQLTREERLGMDVAELRAAWDEYAQALCALPGKEGAPWDGGGELTPWPEAPAAATAREA